MVVLFPAPLGPRNPKNSPRATVQSMPETARVPSEYTFTRSSTTTISCSDNTIPPVGLVLRAFPAGRRGPEL